MDQKQKRQKVGTDGAGEVRYVWYPFRSLVNYKDMHRKRAEKMGVLKEFEAAPTLTRARRIVFP